MMLLLRVSVFGSAAWGIAIDAESKIQVFFLFVLHE
jgi:hypothetical protein